MRTPALRFLHSWILESGMSWQISASENYKASVPG
jgi:hypothetical protein